MAGDRAPRGAGVGAHPPSWKLAALLGAAIWCFARAYTFAFYLIEHYVDPSYRFAGLTSFVRYVLSRRKVGRCDCHSAPHVYNDLRFGEQEQRKAVAKGKANVRVGC